MSRKRTSRNRRRAAGKVRLTPRDEALLRALSRMRLARSSDLRRLLFRDRSSGRVAERLRQLFHAGFLEVRVGRLSEENVYVLGPLGRRWVESAVGTAGRIPAGGHAHHLAIVGAWTHLVEAAGRAEAITLRRVRPDWELREMQSKLTLPVVPDALIELELFGRLVRLALEVDLGTERHRALRRKFEGYQRLRWTAREAWGWTELRVVVLVAEGAARRTASLRTLAEQCGAGGIEVLEREAWPLAALTPLTNPGNGKRGPRAVSESGAGPCPTGDGGLSPKDSAGSVGS